MADRRFDISIILGMVDKASKQLKGINGWVKKNEEQFRQLGIAAGVMGAAAAAGIAVAVKKASDLEEVQAKFNTVFRNNTKFAEESVKILRESYALSEIAAKKYLSSVQDLLVPMGLQREAASKLSNEVVKLAADLGSFNNMPTEKVMMDIQSALVGNFETMKKYGVVLNETRTQQEAMNLGLWNGKGLIDASAKAQAAYSLMIKGSSDAMGDMQRTSQSFANQMKFTLAKIDDMTVALGKGFLPVATRLFNVLNKDVIPILTAFLEEEENIIKITNFTVNSIKFLINVVMGLVGAFDLAGQGIASFAALMSGQIKAAALGFEELGDKVMAYGEQIKAIAKTNSEEFVKSDKKVMASAVEKSNFVLQKQMEENEQFLQNAIIFAEQRKETEKATLDEMKKLREESNQTFIGGWQNAVHEAQKTSINFFKHTQTLFSAFTSAVSSGFEDMLLNIQDGWSSVMGGMQKIAEGLRNAIVKVISDIAAEWIVKHALMKAATLAWKAIEISASAAVAAARAAAASAWSLWGAIAIGASVGIAVLAMANQFAKGVDNFSGGLALVGERGPELVNLPAGSSVFSNRKSQTMLASANGGINITVNVTGNQILDETGAEGLADRIGEVIMQRVKDERNV
jgi:hypothetical protein